jgi:hypothetical protein
LYHAAADRKKWAQAWRGLALFSGRRESDIACGRRSQAALRLFRFGHRATAETSCWLPAPLLP